MVPTTTLSGILAKYNFDVINLLCDCEGPEIDLALNEPNVLRDHVKWLIMETHENFVGKEAVAQMLASLAGLGFAVRERHGDFVLALENTNL